MAKIQAFVKDTEINQEIFIDKLEKKKKSKVRI